MGAARQIDIPSRELLDLERQIADSLQKAGVELLERGFTLLKAGRLEPSDPLEKRALSLARLQTARNELLTLAGQGEGVRLSRPGIYWVTTAPSGRRTLSCDGKHVHISLPVEVPREAELEMARALLAHALSTESRRILRDQVPAALVDAWLVEHREQLARDGGHWSRKQVRAWVEAQSC